MERRWVGYALAVAGVLLVVVSALADPLGIGEGGGFGWKQTVGVVVGALLVAAGGWLTYSRSVQAPASES